MKAEGVFHELLVCPVCHTTLPLDVIRRDGQGACSACERRFAYARGIYQLIPFPIPHRGIRRRWDTWLKLQENGLLSYTEDPKNNLSVGGRQDVAAFAKFARVSGRVLDIGCGPQSIPAYWTSPQDGELVGIDPLLGREEHSFPFVQGIGEYLPFRDEVFDQVLIASSLDHALRPRQVLQEARRVLKPTGHLVLWFFNVHAGRHRRWIAIARRRVRKLKRGFHMLSQGNLEGIHAGLQRMRKPREVQTIQRETPEYLSRLHVPRGAVDFFHFGYYRRNQLVHWLRQAGFVVSRVVEHQSFHLFIDAQPLSKTRVSRRVGRLSNSDYRHHEEMS